MMTSDEFADLLDETDRRAAAREALILTILAAGERALTIPGDCGGPIELLVHRDTYPGREGRWRLTRFEAGEPFGHTDAETFESAVREARWWGARYDQAREPSAL